MSALSQYDLVSTYRGSKGINNVGLAPSESAWPIQSRSQEERTMSASPCLIRDATCTVPCMGQNQFSFRTSYYLLLSPIQTIFIAASYVWKYFPPFALMSSSSSDLDLPLT